MEGAALKYNVNINTLDIFSENIDDILYYTKTEKDALFRRTKAYKHN